MSNESVLVVEDEANARNALVELVRERGYRVEGATDGLEALAKVREKEPDIILTDLKMPGMDGLQLLRTLRGQAVPEREPPAVIVMTAFGAIDSAVSALKEGAADYLTKPLDVTALLLVIEKALAARHARREAERTKAELEATHRDLEAFAGRVAHDLRAPLAPIVLLAECLKESADPGVARAGQKIASNAHRVSEMIEGLLAFSRAGHGDRQSVTDAAPVVRESLEDFAASIAADEVTTEADFAGEATVACPSSLFREIVDNLVSNALTHLRGRERRWIKVTLLCRGSFVDLEVADSGPGIPAESLPQIFDLLYRVPGDPAPGSGIGLATVKRIVDAHGGEITVQSTLGVGTTFRVRLPAARG